MIPEHLRSLLPWDPPFLMIDRVLEWVPHKHILTLKKIAGDDLMALAHRPGCAVLPGMMVLEGMSQSAALLFQVSFGRVALAELPLLGHLKATFPGAATTGEEIAYDVRALKMTKTGGVFEGTARVEGRSIAEAELAFAMVKSPARRESSFQEDGASGGSS